MIFQGAKTKKGLPAFWEKRQDSANGFMQLTELISDENFAPKKVVFLNHTESMPKHLHAIFIAKIGDIITRVVNETKANKKLIEFYVITGFDEDERKTFIQASKVYSGTSLEEIAEEYGENARLVAEAAIQKLDCETVVSFYCQNSDFTGKPA